MLVSVVIPTFDRGDMIKKAIDSALAQDYSRKEIIVVDDCSTDNTGEIVATYGSRLQYIRHSENKGVGAARNTGIAEANGELIAFLDSDDWWNPTKLSKQVDLFTQFPDSGIISAGCVLCDVVTDKRFYKSIPPPIIPLEKLCISMCLPGSASNELIPAEILSDVGGFAEDMIRAQDYHLYLRIAWKFPVRAVPEVLCVKGVHSGVRPGVNIEKTLECRERILALVEDPDLRSKNRAWMYFVLARRLFLNRRWVFGAQMLAKSALVHPRRISADHDRLRVVAREIYSGVFS